MRRLLTALVALLMTAALGAPALAESPGLVSRPGQYEGYAPVLYDEWVRTSQYVPTRDGTRLAVDLYRPAVDGKPVDRPFPVVWEHQLSRASRAEDGSVSLRGVTSGMADLTAYGYVVAFVDRRGNGASFGTMTGYHSRTEAADAYDITEWLAAQPWSDGEVGVFGCSNTGDAAMQAATVGAPHLKAVFAGNYSFHKYDAFQRGGIRANWGVGPNRTREEDLRNLPVDADPDGTLLRQAVEQHQANTSLRDMWRAAPYRDSYVDSVGTRPWTEYSVATYREAIERSGVPLYSYDGWDDDFRKESLVSAATLSNPHKVLIGPWQHCENQGFDIVAERHRFFDYWLKGIDNGIMDEPPVHYYTGSFDGTGQWRDTAQWPPRPSARQTRYYLADGPTGTVDSVNDGGLTRDRPRGHGGKDDYTVDYSVSCPDPVDQEQTCPQDAKGLTYTTAPLKRHTELTGHPVVSLRLSATSADGNVFAYLSDVAPDGTVRILTDGRLRLALRGTQRAPYDVLGTPWRRGDTADARPMPSGKAERVDFDMLPLSSVVPAGHRLRITITGADVRESDRTEVSPAPVYTVHREPARASSITLPVV
ncbi:CocE/NonD family hydrolase [Streptomyces luomodiensis]|uniref:CocE/NonD family hydrolase n=1 Tax=Streptomyces luomodiensis TaxID=3026192 RepID=A0ABY9UUN8_9ACTN|nr:CocE/NonD family hydrolase [Streptomyces sp. SCA4-21]WNE95163.1 CocE/NonD family hydrolase [Streptomyces sp. SCA4-21]